MVALGCQGVTVCRRLGSSASRRWRRRSRTTRHRQHQRWRHRGDEAAARELSQCGVASDSVSTRAFKGCCNSPGLARAEVPG